MEVHFAPTGDLTSVEEASITVPVTVFCDKEAPLAH